MRDFLQADPDTIMVGESRDKETVSMGVDASLIGHMVFWTLHTNLAPESRTQLLDMGTDSFYFRNALLSILAQRLAKKLCDWKECCVPSAQELNDFIKEYAEELCHSDVWWVDDGGKSQNLLNEWTDKFVVGVKLKFYRATGRDKCNKPGYRGRTGLQQFMIT